MVYKSYPRLGDGNIEISNIRICSTSSLQKLSPIRGRKPITKFPHLIVWYGLQKLSPIRGWKLLYTKILKHHTLIVYKSYPRLGDGNVVQSPLNVDVFNVYKSLPRLGDGNAETFWFVKSLRAGLQKLTPLRGRKRSSIYVSMNNYFSFTKAIPV